MGWQKWVYYFSSKKKKSCLCFSRRREILKLFFKYVCYTKHDNNKKLRLRLNTFFRFVFYSKFRYNGSVTVTYIFFTYLLIHLFTYLQYPQGSEALVRRVGIIILLNHFAKCGGVLHGCDVTGKAIPSTIVSGRRAFWCAVEKHRGRAIFFFRTI